jgi:hypothetical protein
MFCFVCLFILASVFAVSQESRPSRGSIPEELLRPKKGEASRYPVDIIIGELGRGAATPAAFFYANSVTMAFMSGQMEHPALSSIDSSLRESHLSLLEVINPESYRIGGGRVEADGTISFLIRFLGKDQGITGELYLRYVSRQIEGSDGVVTTTGNWTFDELLLEDPKYRDVELQEALQRDDFYPYERFY